jgi:nucleotidyltransferase/DNA polymerase involved in DNA repair
MPLAEAKSLAARSLIRKAPSVAHEALGSEADGQSPERWYWLEQRVDRDLQALKALADCCQWFSPVVGLEEQETPSCLMLDITGVSRLFGGERALSIQLLGWLTRRGYWPKVAVADTLGMAWGVAHFARSEWGVWEDEVVEDHGDNPSEGDDGVRSLGRCRTLPSRRRVAWGHGEAAGKGQEYVGDAWLEAVQAEVEGTEREREEQVASSKRFLEPCVVPVGDRWQLGVLPVAALRIHSTTCETLRQLGIETIDQLGGLPRQGLATRLGEELLKRWDQAWGWSQEVLVSFRQPPELTVKIDLEVPAVQQDAVEYWLNESLHRMTEQLWHRQLGVLRMDVVLHGVDQPPVRMRLDLFRPTVATDHLGSLLQLQLQRERLPQAVREVEIQAVLVAPLENQQMELFDSQLKNEKAISDLVNRLSSRLGAEQVVEVSLRHGAQPEYGFRTRPVAGQPRKKPRKTMRSEQKNLQATTPDGERCDMRTSEAVRKRLRRPLRLFPKPLLLKTVGEGGKKPPASILWQGQARRVQSCWGPERIETGWWRGPMVQRDYYRIELETGQRLWVYRDLESDGWFLHGDF